MNTRKWLLHIMATWQVPRHQMFNTAQTNCQHKTTVFFIYRSQNTPRRSIFLFTYLTA